MKPEGDYYNPYIEHLKEQLKELDFTIKKYQEEVIFFQKELRNAKKNFSNHKPFCDSKELE